MLTAHLDGMKAKLAAIGAPQSVVITAKAFEESVKVIAEVNKALERHHTQLNEAQKGQIRLKETQIANIEAETQWKSRLDSTSSSIEQRIRSMQLLTAAIGKGYEAQRTANVEISVMQAVGDKFTDRKSTRLNSSHTVISYAAFCL